MLPATLFSGETIWIVPGVLSAEDACNSAVELGRKLSAMMVMLPPGPPKALAVIALPFITRNFGSISTLPPAPWPLCTEVVICEFSRRTR